MTPDNVTESNPTRLRPAVYFRAFVSGAVWFAAIAAKMISRHSGPWSTYPFRNLIALIGAGIITALLVGVAATHIQKLRSWAGIGLATVAGSFVVLSLMLFTAERIYGPPRVPKFQTTDQMMTYFAGQAAQWVKKDRGIDLDYSLESVRVVEEELGRIAKEVDRANPKPGTFGIAMGYGAYIGEVFRRRNGGSWAADHPTAGQNSYPLTIKTNSVIFPIGWCWKRLTSGEEDNVYHKAMLFDNIDNVITNRAGVR